MDATLADPLAGRELDGRYLVRSRIARGGMATVYLAVDQRLDREVALKVMHAHLADDEQFTSRFIREARSAARLSHPNVVQVFDQGSDGDLLYLTMEYLRGRTLREVLAERRALTPREALTVVEPVLDALAAAHRVGLVHRDIKPENVILTDEGRVKVADFGLARAATATTSTIGVLMGTVAYMAPELVLQGVSDTRSDVYAAGIMIYEMLTGRQPFTGAVPIQVAYQHVNDHVPAPSLLAPGLAPALDGVVAAATAREPDDRPADADHLLTMVRSAHAGLTSAQLDARPVVAPAVATSATGGTAGSATTGNATTGNATTGSATVGNGADALPGRAPRTWPGSPTEVVPALPPREQAGPQHTQVLPDLAADAAIPAAAPSSAAAPAGSPESDRDTGAPAEDEELTALLQRRRRVGTAALLGVLALALGLALAAWYVTAGPGAYRSAPRVSGLTVLQARDALERAGLHDRELPVFDATIPAGIVVRSVPDAGQGVRNSGTVTLDVSQGPQIVTVPAVTGQTQDAASTALAAARLAIGTVRLQYDDTPPGQVLAVAPVAGRRVRNGTAVTLTVSRGPAPVTVPNVVGDPRADAESALAQVRLQVAYGPPVNDAHVPAGAVVSQSPASGTLVPGQSVTLVLSKGPVLVPVPQVVSMQAGAATALLQHAGFQVRQVKLFGGFFGTVRFESPGGGSQAPQGSTVTITVI